MANRLLCSMLCLLLCLSLGGCGLLSRSSPTPQNQEPATPSPYVGQVASLHSAQGFVLIRRMPSVTVAPGTILISTGPNGSVANLRVSGESLGLMIAADIQSGTPQVGDSVNHSALEEEDIDLSEAGN